MGKRLNKLTQKIAPVIATVSVLATSISPVMAAQTIVRDEFDKTLQGSITLYKYVNNDGGSFNSDGTPIANRDDEQLSAIENATGDYRMIPEQNVNFAYLKVGDYEYIQNTDTNEVGMYVTNLDENFIATLTEYGIVLEKAGIADNAYDLEDVQKAMTTICKATNSTMTGEEAVRTYVDKSGTRFEPTNAYGKTSVSGLEVGLYLVAEVDWQHQSLAKHDTFWQRSDDEGTADAGDGSDYADIVSPSSPILMTLPFHNTTAMSYDGKDYAAGQGWIYDLTAYPKNSTLTIHQDYIVDDSIFETGTFGLDTADVETLCDYAQINYLNTNQNGEYEQGTDDDTAMDWDNTGYVLTHQIDKNIGDAVVQLISSDVPALVGDKKNKTYKITEYLSEGLTVDKSQDILVYLSTSAWNDFDSITTGFDERDDYNVTYSEDGHSFTVEFTPSGLHSLDDISSASYLYIIYSCELNKNAQTGTDTYEYTTHDNEVVDATNQGTAMLTYATDHTSEHDYYSNTTKIYTYEIDITKQLKDATNAAEKDYSKVTFSVEALTKNNGYVAQQFVKDSDGVYHVYDSLNDNAADIVKLVSPGTDGLLRIRGVDSTDYHIVEESTAPGFNLLGEDIYVRLVANMSGSRKFEDGSLDHAYQWTGEEPVNLKRYDILNTESGSQVEQGKVPITIINGGFSILRTGGAGTLVIKIIGAGLIIGAGTILVLRAKNEKKREDEDNA